MFPWNEKPERGYARQNHPFTKPHFRFLSILGNAFYVSLGVNQTFPDLLESLLVPETFRELPKNLDGGNSALVIGF